MAELSENRILYEKIIKGGWSFSHHIKRGTAVRLTDIEGGANVSALFYNTFNFTQRYNMGDTLKIQHISCISKNNCIYSDMGKILMSVVEDTCGSHDVICGVTNRGTINKKFGAAEYREFKNDYYRNGYDSLITELYKYGMGKRDFTEVINFFSKINVDIDGNLSFVKNFTKPGDHVDLRAETDTLMVFDTGMHPLNPSEKYLVKPVKFTIYKCESPGPDDPCRNSCMENDRGFINTEISFI